MTESGVEGVICLDTVVWIKFLVTEEPLALSDAATLLVHRALTTARLVAPAFAWAEVGSVLRKKVRQAHLRGEEAEELWDRFLQIPIDYLETPELRKRAWEIAERYTLATLYDAAFLASTELAPVSDGALREFWTSDEELLRALGADRPGYVRQLGADAHLS